jgi:3-methyladenine DNA glycosylase AlkD
LSQTNKMKREIIYLKIINELREEFVSQADVDRAEAMKKYMRDQFDFFGVPKPIAALMSKPFQKQLLLLKEDVMSHVVHDLWKRPQRDFQYFAMEYAYKSHKTWNENHLELFEWMVIHKSWWDTVDFIASNLFGKLFQKFPHLIEPSINRWNAGDNFWLHRTSIIFQLKYGIKTDQKLLFTQCKRFAPEKEFFIRKAIGWSLRQYSKFNPDAVRNFIENTRLSPLSMKEGLKYIEP